MQVTPQLQGWLCQHEKGAAWQLGALLLLLPCISFKWL